MPILNEGYAPPEDWDVPDILKPPKPVPIGVPVSTLTFTDPIPQPSILTRPPAWKALDFTSRLGHVDSASNSLLPTNHVLALGESSLQDSDLRSAARVLARQYDLPPEWFFKSLSGTSDVFLTHGGEVITASQAQTLIRPQETKVLLDMLRSVAGPDERIDVMPVGRKREQFSVSRPSVSTVAQVVNAMVSSDLAGQLSLSTMLGAAVQVAGRLDGVKGGAQRFGENIKALRGQSAGHWSISVGMAEDAAAKGRTFASAADAFATYGAQVAGRSSEQGLAPEEFRRRVRESSVQQIPMRIYQGTYYFFDPIAQSWRVAPTDVIPTGSLVTATGAQRNAPELGFTGESAFASTEAPTAVRMATPPDTWGMPTNVATKYGGDGVYKPPDTRQIAAMGFLPGVGGFDVKRPQDFYRQARIIAHQAEIDRQGWNQSFLGWTVGRIGDGANFVYRYTEAGVMAIATVGAYPLNLFGGTDEANRRFWQDVQHIDDIKNGRSNLGQLIASSLDLPKEAGPLIDLGISFGADPFLVAGRIVKGLRAGRSLIDLTETLRGGVASRGIYRLHYGTAADIQAKIDAAVAKGATREAAVAQFDPLQTRITNHWAGYVGRAILKPSGLWDGKSLVRFATETAWDAKRPLYSVISERARTLRRVEGVDPEMAHRIEQAVGLAKRGGLTLDQTEPLVRDLFAAGLGAKPLHPQFFDVLTRQLDDQQAARLTQVSQLATTLKMNEPETLRALANEFTRYDREVAASILSEVETSYVPGRIIQFELPYGSRSLQFRNALNRAAGDTYLGRGARALTTRLPTPLTGFEAGEYAQQTERKLRRGRVFSQSEIEAITNRARNISEVTNANRERSMVRLAEQVQKETWTRIASEYGLSPEGADTLYSRLTSEIDKANASNAEAYGVKFTRDESGEIVMTAAERPLFETQLLNGYYTADPVMMRKAIRDAIGFRRSVEQVLRHFTFEIPDEELALARQSMTEREKWLARLTRTAKPVDRLRLDPTLGDWAENAWQWLAHDHFIRYWKAAQVIRPGYILRVPAADEQIRGMLDLGIYRMTTARAVVGKNAERLAEQGILPKGWVKTVRTLPTADGKGFDVTFRIPGALPHEAYANSRVGFGQVWESVAEQMRQVSKGVAQEGWGVVSPADGIKKWSDAWSRAVNGQYGHSLLGRQALADLADGVSRERSVARIEKLLADDRYGQSVAGRIGRDAAETNDWANEVVDEVRRAVNADPRIAEAALRGRADPAMLRRAGVGEVPDLPPVHGLKAEIIAGKSNPIKPVFDSVARWILQEPTNRLSRQPFFKAWFDRILWIQVENAVASGTVYKNAEEAEQALSRMEATARRFAVDRVRKVMFDLRDQSRLAEMMGFVSPFFQPFQEAFSVYGHLIRVNPALVGWARVAWQGAVESGFIKKDDTGQYVVPLTAFGKMAGLLTATGFHSGFGLTAPLTSFNLFFNNAFPIPTGKLAGNLSIPIPGLSPPLMWLAQKFIKSDDASKLSNWAYQYGPVGVQSLLPTWLNNAITSIDPKWNENGWTAYTDDFLRLNQYLGLKFKNTAEAAKVAEDQAKTFYRWKAGISLISPAGPTIKFPTEEIEGEFRDLVKRYTGEGKTWSDARDEFLRRHPDLWLITIGKTVWERQDPGLPSTLNAPAIPSTELADRILAQPGFHDFAKRFPALAFAILPQAAFAQGDYSPDVFRKQLANADRRYLSPEEFAAAGEEAQGWHAYWALRDNWDAWQETHDVSQTSVEYQAQKGRFDAAVQDLRTRYPSFDNVFGTFSEAAADPRVMAYLRQAAKDEVLGDFPVGKALKSYLSQRDDIAQAMSAKGITQITSVSATESGLTKRYSDMVAGLERRYPDFGRVYDTFLRDDLMSVRAEGDKALDDLPPEVRQNVFAWEQRMNGLRKQIDLAPTDADRSKLYSEEAQWVDRAYTDFGDDPKKNPVLIWYASQDYQTKKRIQASVQTKPYIFLNRFERSQILGEPTDDYSEAAWAQIAEARDAISAQAAIDPNFSSSAAYQQLDAYVAQVANAHPVFAAQVQHANEWGWALWNHSAYAKEAGPAGDAWRNLHDAASQIQQWALANDLHGAVGSKEEQVQWNGVKSALLDYVNQLGGWSPTFRRQWLSLDENYRGNLIDVIFPETYFALGGQGA